MDTILNLLSGKKTYFLSALGLVVIGLWMFGLVDDTVATKALVVLGFGTQISLRAATAKSEAQAAETAQKVAALQRGERTYLG